MVRSSVSVGVLHPRGSVTGANIRQAVTELGHRAVRLHYDDPFIKIRNGTPEITSDIDVLVNWHTLSRKGKGIEYLGLLRAVEEIVPVINPAENVFLAGHKPSSLVKLSHADGVNVPDTFYSMDCRQLAEESCRWSELVQKPVLGGGGAEVSKIEEGDFSVLSGPQYGLLQDTIETPGDSHHDVRAFVVDGEVVEAMERNAPDDQWLTNISSGGDGDSIDLPEEASQMAVRAAEVLGLDAAGIDLIQSKHGDWFVIEANAPAGFAGLHEATGTNVAPFIASAAITRAGKQVIEKTAELADSMDLVKPTRFEGGMAYELTPGRDYELAGRDGTTEVEYDHNEEFDGYAVDKSIAGEIGAGPVTGTEESPIPGDDSEVITTRLWVHIGGDSYHFDAKLIDLSEYDADFISEIKGIVERTISLGDGEETLHNPEHLN